MPDFSSLMLFYPGAPPALSVGELRRFCDRLREAVATGGTGRAVRLKYGARVDQDYETTEQANWDEAGVLGKVAEYPWDHAKAGAWGELWPAGADGEARQVYRAQVELGNLPPKVSRGLTAARSEQAGEEFIAPDALAVEINPVCPATLATAELTAYGLIQVAFTGDGFFSWQPLERYWKQVRGTSALGKARAVCRESFPVPPLDYLDSLRQEMGALFLNRDEYQPGDWIVSISEMG